MSVKPKNTDRTIAESGKPGAKALAGPKHKAMANDLKMNVDSNKEALRGTAPATQRGGHNRKK